MSRRFRSPSHGFSLIEAVVSILILIVVLTLTLSLLFSMRSFAERQQFKTAPRQTARRTIDYLAYFMQGASDLNDKARHPNALVMYYRDGAGALKQGSYNNVTDASLADLGTDVISMLVPNENPVSVPVANWTGFSPAGDAFALGYVAGCPDNAVNDTRFASASGGVGAVLPIIDSAGIWSYMRIKLLDNNSDCTKLGAGQTDILTIKADAGDAAPIRPSSGTPAALTAPVTVALGLQYLSFRVRGGRLEQKFGLFDPACDNPTPTGLCPGPAFQPIMENVEDFQVAYIFRDGSAWNTAARQLSDASDAPLTAAVPNGIPYQRGNTPFVGGSPPPQDETYDVQNVVGLRLSLVARSDQLPLGSLNLTSLKAIGPTPAAGENVVTYFHYQPDAEDHPLLVADLAADAARTTPTAVGRRFDYFRLTSTVLLRNRIHLEIK